MRCDEFYKKWRKCGNFCEKHPSTASRIEKYLDQIEEMTQVLSEPLQEESIETAETGKQAMQSNASEKEATPTEHTPNEATITPIENVPIGNFSEGSIRPLLKEKDTEIREEAIRRSALLAERKKKEFGKKKADVSAKEMETVIQGIKDEKQLATNGDKQPTGTTSPPLPHVARNAGDNEWYTPKEYIEAARQVMGSIDIDPASTEEANAVVGAARFYTADENGLLWTWVGNIWMNPPYAPDKIGAFVSKLCDEYKKGDVTQACVLVNNATETRWFQEVLAIANAVAFPKKRVRFWHPRKESAPLQGQAVIYLGDNIDSFHKNFSAFGVMCDVVR